MVGAREDDTFEFKACSQIQVFISEYPDQSLWDRYLNLAQPEIIGSKSNTFAFCLHLTTNPTFC